MSLIAAVIIVVIIVIIIVVLIMVIIKATIINYVMIFMLLARIKFQEAHLHKRNWNVGGMPFIGDWLMIRYLYYQINT
jgi:hypothetical protein